MQLSDVTPKLRNQLSRLIRTEVKNLMRAEAEAMKAHALSREQQRQQAEDRRRIEFYDGIPLSELIADQLCLVRSAGVDAVEVYSHRDDRDILDRAGYNVAEVDAALEAFNTELKTVLNKYDSVTFTKK